MTKPFSSCSLTDLAHEIHLASLDTVASALNPAVAALVMPSFLDTHLTETVMNRHPDVRAGGVLVCTAALDSKKAWCSLLCDLLDGTSASVSDAARFRIYIVFKECSKRGQVRLPVQMDTGAAAELLLKPSEDLQNSFLPVLSSMIADGDADGTAAHSVLKKSLKYDSHTLMPSFSILTVLQGQAQYCGSR